MNTSISEEFNKLRIETKITNYVDWFDLAKYIQKCYDFPHRFEILEAGNDTDYSLNIKKEELSEYTLKDLKKVFEQSGIEHWRLHSFLTDMCNKDFLPEGNYLIRVSW